MYILHNAQSQIMYSIVIWGASPHLADVFVAQKRVVRAMAGVRYWRSHCELDSCRPFFQRYEIMTVYSLFMLECMKYLKRHPEKFTKSCDVPKQGVKTRRAAANACPNDLFVSYCSLQISSQNPATIIPRIFNALPVNIRMIEDDKEFVCKIRELVLRHQFYDLDEFFVCNFDL